MAIPRILKPAILASPSSHFTPSVPSLPIPFKTHSKSLFFTIIPSGIHGHHTPPPTLSRRLFLPSVSGIWDALTGGNNAHEAGVAIRRGMLLFRQGDVQGSLVEFDKAIELDPRQKAYLWQRGLSLYYLDRFEEGAEQFRLDVAQNPNDTEESIWCFLCEVQLYGISEARKRFLELVAEFSNGQENEKFYASLYAGLYYESEKKADAAKLHVLASCQTPYGQRSNDYMASLAKVHCICRNWSLN
ncbi:uncharacterized protein LOC122317861 isoform X2 [Carya illinoinensis]|uniref:Uncharacterized protein n=1 Tax=Carya illinoinensis TaxID=32201 RepID=A0A8T1PVU9_CARIL|nr:uncharacterized protein LOC122317861 isoform X2 [Carya illinoinensis]KAG6645954.1 hypothetical protein CIPAW_08G158800 [Carya illinoinensis]